MKRTFIIIFILILGLASLDIFANEDYKFIKDIEVKKDNVFKGNIVSIEGDIIINGSVSESIIILGGKIELNGNIKGDVICIASVVIIGDKSKIGGDLVILGDAPKQNDGEVLGKYHLFELDLKKIREKILPILTGSNGFFIINLIKTVLWFILVLIIFAAFTNKIYTSEGFLSNNPKKVCIVSLLGIISFIALLVMFVLLSFLIIGIPFLFSLFVFYFVVLTFGRTVFLYFIGKNIANYIKIKNISPILYLFIGFSIYVLLLFIPYVGRIILLGFNIIEFGIGLSYFFRKRLKF